MHKLQSRSQILHALLACPSKQETAASTQCLSEPETPRKPWRKLQGGDVGQHNVSGMWMNSSLSVTAKINKSEDDMVSQF